MEYLPKLKTAADEIKAVLKKHDIAGIVVLHGILGEPQIDKAGIHTQGFTEYLFHITPSYSAAELTPAGRFVVKGKAAHYPSPDERDKRLSSTFNMFEHLSEWTSKLALQAMQMEELVKTLVEDVSTDHGSHTSHNQQNN